MATTFLYRCPNTAQTVQGWPADDVTDDHAVGVYHISEAPMTEEDWIKHTSNAAQLELEATHSDATSVLPSESKEKPSN